MTTGVLCSGRKRVYRSAAIHLWRFSLAHAENGISWARPLLSPEELERGAHFCRPRDGSRFLLCRACAKTILAAHRPDVRACDIVFSYGPWGKPCWRDLPFSISHSGTEALLAVCEGCPIGCDIQWTGSAVDDAVSRTFSIPGNVWPSMRCPRTIMPAASIACGSERKR